MKMSEIWQYVIPIVLTSLVTWYTIYLTRQFRKASIANQTTLTILTKKIDSIASDIKDEQKIKGSLNLKLPFKKEYLLRLGSEKHEFMLARDTLLKEEGYNAFYRVGENYVLDFKLKNDELLVSTTLYDMRNNVIAEIKDNNWAVGSNIFSKNWNEHAFEVIDNRGNVALQINLKGNIIEIKGILPNPSGIFLLTEEHYWGMVPYDEPQLLQIINDASKSIKRIFEHTGSNYLGTESTFVEKELERLKETEKTILETTEEFEKLSNNQLMIKAVREVRIIYKLIEKYEIDEKSITENYNAMLKKEKDEEKGRAFQKKLKGSKILINNLKKEYEDSYMVNFISMNNVLKERLLKYDFSEYARSINYRRFRDSDNLFSLIYELEIMAKSLVNYSKKEQSNSKTNEILKAKGSKIVEGVRFLKEEFDKEKETIVKKYQVRIQSAKSKDEKAIISYERDKEIKLVNIRTISIYNINYKIDAVVLRREIMRKFPNHKPTVQNESYYYSSDCSIFTKVIQDLELMIALLK